MKEAYFNGQYYRTNEFQSGRLTLAFVHGVSGSSSAWLSYEKMFENKYNVLTHDIRGHGMSKKYPNYSDYEIKNFVNDLHELVTHLNITKFILISNSFGSLIALEYIKLYRGTVIANVFTSPEVYLGEGFLAHILRPTLSMVTGVIRLLPFNPKPRGRVDYKKYIGSTDWSIGRNVADIKNTGLHAHFYALKQSMNKGQEYNLNTIDVPTLIMHGEKDSMVPMKNAILLSREIKNSQFVSIPNVDHNTAHNAVKAMSDAIESFIEQNRNVLQ